MIWAGRIVLVAAWLAALYGLLAAESGYAYTLGGTALTFAVGAAVNTWWVLPVPLLVTAVLVLVTDDGPCLEAEDCSDLIGLVTLVFFAVPAMIVLALGIGARRLVTSRR